MNLYYRLVHILKKIVYTFFILSISYNQDYPNGSFSLDQIFFQLNSLNIASEFSKDSLNNGKLSLNLLKIGFDDLVCFEIVTPTVRPYKLPMNEEQFAEFEKQSKRESEMVEI